MRETRGRPPSGEHGERVSAYPRVAVRVPVVTKARLMALAEFSGKPVWKVCAEAIEALAETDQAAMTEADRRAFVNLAKRYAARLRTDAP